MRTTSVLLFLAATLAIATPIIDGRAESGTIAASSAAATPTAAPEEPKTQVINKAPNPPPIGTTIGDTTPLTWSIGHAFPNGPPIVGGSHVEFHGSGNVRWKSTFSHVSGDGVVGWAVVCCVQDRINVVYALTRDGVLGGAGTPSADDVRDETKTFGVVQDRWGDIIEGNRVLHCAWKGAGRKLTAAELSALFDFAVGGVAKPPAVVFRLTF